MRARTGFTLLEVIVVVAILGILAALTAAAVQKARHAATRTDVLNRVRQIGLGLQQYATAHQGSLPGFKVRSPIPGGNVSPLFNILPYVDPPFPYPYHTTRNGGHFDYPVPLYFSPADPTLDYALSETDQMSSFVVNWEVFKGPSRLPNSIGDGTSQTVGVSEKYCRPKGEYRARVVHTFYSPPAVAYEPGSEFGRERSCTFADLYLFTAPAVAPVAGPARCRPRGASG